MPCVPLALTTHPYEAGYMADDKFTREVERLYGLSKVILPILQQAITEAEERGRREVLAEISRMDPSNSCDVREWQHCVFCLVDGIEWRHNHTAECLWRRARVAVHGE